MPILTIKKVLEFNKEGFHASNVIESRISIAEIFPDRVKTNKEDALHLTILQKDFNEEKNTFISLNADEIKELHTLLSKFVKK